MIIKDTDKSDLRNIAYCHARAFPRSLTSKLGISYSMKMLSFYLEDKRGILFHLADDNKIIGYCGGLRRNDVNKPGSATSMVQFTFKSLIVSLLKKPWLLFHPEIVNNIPLIVKNLKLRLFRHSLSTSKTTKSTDQNFIPSMGLVVIGVDPEYQGKGYGSFLLKEFEKRAREEGFHRMHLSVRKDNIQAISSYKKNGWEIQSENKHELKMFKELL